MSLRMLDLAGTGEQDSVIDVGAGGSPLRGVRLLRPGRSTARACPSPATAQANSPPGWALIAQAREQHITPAGITQPFT